MLELWHKPIEKLNNEKSFCNIAVTDAEIAMFRNFSRINVLIHFYTPIWKIGHIMGTPAAGGRRPQGFRCISQTVFIRTLSNLVNMLVGIISWPSSITSQIPHALSGICRISCSQKCCYFLWIYYKYDSVFCVSSALLLFDLNYSWFGKKTGTIFNKGFNYLWYYLKLVD